MGERTHLPSFAAGSEIWNERENWRSSATFSRTHESTVARPLHLFSISPFPPLFLSLFLFLSYASLPMSGTTFERSPNSYFLAMCSRKLEISARRNSIAAIDRPGKSRTRALCNPLSLSLITILKRYHCDGSECKFSFRDELTRRWNSANPVRATERQERDTI